MSLKFSLYKTPVPSNRSGKQLEHARIIHQGTINTDELCKMISETSSFSSADVKGVIEALSFWLNHYLTQGYSVEMDDLGYFSPTLKSKNTVNEKGEKKINVEIDSIGFRCAMSLKKKIRNATLEKVSQKKKEQPLKAEQRKENILSLFKSDDSINTLKCMSINHCSRYIALQDINDLVNENKLHKIGHGKRIIYILPYQQDDK